MANLADEFLDDTTNSSSITIGTVVGIDDPDQMGRIRVRCSSWGDNKLPNEKVPLARYCAPFAGTSRNIGRGAEGDTSEGAIAYGQWMIPEIGSRVIVIILDHDPNQRYWIGAAHDTFYPHTLPHGRYLDDKLPKTSSEGDIQPLTRNLKAAFDSKLDSPEYATRGMDRQASAVKQENIGYHATVSKVSDETNQTIESYDGSTIEREQGYSADGQVSAIYSVTTPGFHSFSMDDDPQHCRTKLRTTAGHQIIMDDTNERIYISTAKGNTWIEIDEKGTIDIYGSEDISLRSDGKLNLSAKKTVRISGGEGVHIASTNDIRLHSKLDTHIRADADIKTHTTNFKIHTDSNMELQIDGDYKKTANKIIINSETTYDLDIASTYTMKSDAYEFTGTDINVNVGNVLIASNLTVGINATVTGTILGANVLAGVTLAAPMAAIAGPLTAAGISASGPGGMISAGPIATAGDVSAGGVSLLSHTHMYEKPQHPAGPALTAPGLPTAAPPAPPAPPQTPSPPSPPAKISAAPASAGTAPADELPAYVVTRAPTHEPYTRSYLDKDKTDKDSTGETALDVIETLNSNDIDPVLEYASTNPKAGTGSAKRGISFNRNPNWRR